MSFTPEESMSAYKVHQEVLARFPYNYYTTPVSSPPSAPQLPPSQRRYFYLDVSPPESMPIKATILFLHGFPDSSYGWRNILSAISLSGYRCIVPDLIGYGRSSKPKELAYYGARSQSLDLAGLMTHVMGSDKSKFAVVGHDWGSWLSWKLANWIPDRLLGVHGICVPYAPTTTKYMPTSEVAKKYPEYGYQIFFENPESTNIIQAHLDAFLYLAYGSLPLIIARPELHKLGFVKEGALKKSLENSNHLLPVLSEVTLLSKKDHQVMHLLFDEKMGGTIDGPLNWYRTRKVNHDEDKDLTSKMLPGLPYKILVPNMDATAPMSLAESAGRFIPKGCYEIETVENCGHWVLIEYPEKASQSILKWLEERVLPDSASLLTKIQNKL